MHHGFASRRLLALASASTLAVAAVALLGLGSSASARNSHARQTTKRHGHHHGGGGPSITSAPWGTADGQAVNLYTLSSGNRMTVKITNYGGVVQSIWTPDRRGGVADVALGFNKLSDYVNDFTQTASNPWPAAGGSGNTYFGAIIGRYANRIANASFSLNGKTYTLDANNGKNTLHGGFVGWNTRVWTPSTSVGKNFVALNLKHLFPAGEGCESPPTPSCTGFPAPVMASVTYTLTAGNQLKIAYSATNESTNLATVINLTNHTYFNLAGEGSGTVYDQLLKLNANTFTPVNANLIPTGVFAPVAGTPFDFRKLKPIGQDIRRANMPEGEQLVLAHGYDHNWVLNGSGLRLAAVAEDPASGRTLTAFTTEPGVQVYTGNFLVGDLVGTSGRTYRQGDAFTLETQHYPDTPHHIGNPNWPSVVLNPGHVFRSQTIFKFGTTARVHAQRRG